MLYVPSTQIYTWCTKTVFPAELLTCQYLNVLSLAKKYCLVFKWIKFIFPACFTFQVRKQFPCHHNNPKDGIFPITLLVLKSVLLTQVSFKLRRLAEKKGPDEDDFTKLANLVDEFTSCLLDPLKTNIEARHAFGDSLDYLVDAGINLEQKKVI